MSLERAKNREGVFLQIATADGRVEIFHAFPFTDDPQGDAEQIFMNLHLDLTKFLIEQGFVMSSDNKHVLGI